MIVLLQALISSAQPTSPIRLATYQYATLSRTENIKPLAALIQKETGQKVEVISYPDIYQFVDAIKNDKVDIALISTMGYSMLKNQNKSENMKVSLALTVPNNAAAHYKTAFVAPSSSKLNSLSDLSSSPYKRITLVSPGSTSGNLIPRLIFAEQGISTLETKYQINYSQTHAAAIEAVAIGNTDLAAMGSSAYYDFIQKDENKGKVKLIHLSSEIPLGPVLFKRNMDVKIQGLLQKMFLSLHQSHQPVFKAIKDGWTEAKDAEKFIAIDASYYGSLLKN